MVNSNECQSHLGFQDAISSNHGLSGSGIDLAGYILHCLQTIGPRAQVLHDFQSYRHDSFVVQSEVDQDVHLLLNFVEAPHGAIPTFQGQR